MDAGAPKKSAQLWAKWRCLPAPRKGAQRAGKKTTNKKLDQILHGKGAKQGGTQLANTNATILELHMKKCLWRKCKWAMALVAAASMGMAPAAEPESALTFNVGVVNNYLYRGISQTRGDPAVQGGLDYAHSSGFYVGAWASSIKWIGDLGLAGNPALGFNGPTELDIYGGYKFDLAPGIGMDVGYLRYEYLGNNVASVGLTNPNTDEIYLGMNTPLFNVKFSFATTNLFGQTNNGASATGATYTEFSREFNLGGGYKLTPHAGMTSISKVTNASYNDYSLTLAKEINPGLVLSVGYSGTNAVRTYYVSNLNNKYLGDQAAVVGLKYNF
jgi:uncharacterized protein (TIGR02001 family)